MPNKLAATMIMLLALSCEGASTNSSKGTLPWRVQMHARTREHACHLLPRG